MHYSFHGSPDQIAILKIGTHEYFGQKVEVLPVRTMMNGLCYKLEFLFPLSYETLKYVAMVMTSSNQLQDIDKLKKINLLIAANNTWQGIIHKNWPYSKKPPMMSIDFAQNTYKIMYRTRATINRGYYSFSPLFMAKL